jgi:cardiolipin synthase (CMP-forming)
MARGIGRFFWNSLDGWGVWTGALLRDAATTSGVYLDFGFSVRGCNPLFPIELAKFPVSRSVWLCLDAGVTTASKITVARICLVPVYVALVFYYGHTVKSGHAVESLRGWALGVFVFAAVTDGVDGWVARRFDQCSEFGAFIDPIADKALLLSGVISLSCVDWGEPGWCLPWWFAAVVLLRDSIILGGIRILWSYRREVRVAPHWTGKVTTVCQMMALGWVMLRVTWLPPFYPCLVAAVFTVWSGIAYIRQGREILRGVENRTS